MVGTTMIKKRYRPIYRYPFKKRRTTKKGLANTVSYVNGLQRNYFTNHNAVLPTAMKATLRWMVNTDPIALATGLFVDNVFAVTPYLVSGSYSYPATGFNKMMAIYGKCYVKAFRYTINVTNIGLPGTGVPQPFTVGATVSTLVTSYTNSLTPIGEGMTKSAMLCNNPDTWKATASYDMSKLYGIKSVTESTAYACSVSSNPSQLYYIHVWANSNALFNTEFCIYMTLDMDVEFADQIQFT